MISARVEGDHTVMSFRDSGVGIRTEEVPAMAASLSR